MPRRSRVYAKKKPVRRNAGPRVSNVKKTEKPREAVRTIRYPTNDDIRLAFSVGDAAQTIQLAMLGVSVDEDRLGRAHCAFEDFLLRFEAHYDGAPLSSRYDPEVALRGETAKPVSGKEGP